MHKDEIFDILIVLLKRTTVLTTVKLMELTSDSIIYKINDE